MPYKDLEHEGDEDFLEINRKVAKKTKEKVEEFSEEAKERLAEEIHQSWLSPENPLLWDGEI